VELTATGNEGMVVKSLDFICKGNHRLVQPAVKCRGPEYLRIIYGPEYLLPENLERLCAARMSASLVCWHWKANQWTRGCKGKTVCGSVLFQSGFCC
jgi:hypothetical protein